MDIGDRIRRRREELGMSQEELAMKVGYKNRSSITKIELQRDLPIYKLVPIAEALDCDIDWILGWEENEDNPIITQITDECRKLPDDKLNMILSYVRFMKGGN